MGTPLPDGERDARDDVDDDHDLLTKTSHATACATRLIVALGLTGGLEDVAIMMTAVAILWYLHDRVISTLAEWFGFKPRDARE